MPYKAPVIQKFLIAFSVLHAMAHNFTKLNRDYTRKQNAVRHGTFLELESELMSLPIHLRIPSLSKSDEEHSSGPSQKHSLPLGRVRAKMF